MMARMYWFYPKLSQIIVPHYCNVENNNYLCTNKETMVYSYLYIITALAIIIFSQNRTCTKSLVYKIFDSIDIHCEIQAVPFAELSKMAPGEPSSAIRERVIKARQIQEARFSHLTLGGGREGGRIHCNAQMTEKMLHEFAEPDAQSLEMLRMAMERLSLSARAYSRILKVARTIADLAGSEKVETMHIAEAIGYRNLDRGDWVERGL
jgi:predicted ATPase with chaperone activity